MGVAAGIAAGAAVISGVGDLISGLFGGDGPSQMTPEAQYELERMKIDMGQWAANWTKTVDIYNIQETQRQTNAYNKLYGGAETAAGKYAESAFAGELTPGAKKGITDLGMQLGGQSNLNEQDIINQAIQSGRSLDSPDVQAQLAKARTGIRSAFATGQGTIMGSDYQSSVQNANQIIAAGKTGRISGGEAPEIMLNPQEQQKYNSAMASWQHGGSKGEAPSQSAFIDIAPVGYQTYGQQLESTLSAIGPEPKRFPGGTYASHGVSIGGPQGKGGSGLSNMPYENPEWIAWEKGRREAQKKVDQQKGVGVTSQGASSV